MFEQANTLRKTVYQKATQVPRVGSNSIYIAVNPTQKPHQQQQQQTQHQEQQNNQHQQNSTPATSATATTPTTSAKDTTTDQVSILVRPHKGGKPVLLNVPRKIALKVKNGTTLSFSASSDQKYVVISNKIHPPVGPTSNARKPVAPTASSATSMPNRPSASVHPLQQQQRPRLTGSSILGKSSSNIFAGILPASVSLQPISKGHTNSSGLPLNRRRPAVSVSINRASEPVAKARKIVPGGNVLSSGEM
jgi:hypothetical protein